MKHKHLEKIQIGSVLQHCHMGYWSDVIVVKKYATLAIRYLFVDEYDPDMTGTYMAERDELLDGGKFRVWKLKYL